MTHSNGPRRPLIAAAALATLLMAGPLGAQGADPFQAGLRWIHAADGSAPWVPMGVDFAAGGQLVWGAPAVGTPHLALLSSQDGPLVAPLFEDFGALGAAAPPLVRGSADAARLYSLLQLPDPDPAHRKTLVSRHDALAAAGGSGFAPVWTHDPGFQGPGAGHLELAEDGGRLVVAGYDLGSGETWIDWLDAHTGALAARVRLATPFLRNLSVSADGKRVALTAEQELLLVDPLGGILHREALPAATNALALAADGRSLLVGGYDRLRVLRETGGAWLLAAEHAGAPGEVAVRAAISAGGETHAVAWWEATQGVAVRLEVFDGPSGSRLFEHAQGGPVGGPQNLPQDLAITPDGERVALGLWGAGDPQPEVLLFERWGGAPVLAADLPGSVMDLALDPGGTRVAVAAKGVHAGTLGGLGDLRLYDTGERELQVVGQPALGTQLQLAARRAGAEAVYFLLGAPAAAPTSVPGVGGSLLIDRSRRMRVFARPADPAGRADLLLQLPAHGALLGTPFAVQAAFRTGAALELSELRIEPLVL